MNDTSCPCFCHDGFRTVLALTVHNHHTNNRCSCGHSSNGSIRECHCNIVEHVQFHACINVYYYRRIERCGGSDFARLDCDRLPFYTDPVVLSNCYVQVRRFEDQHLQRTRSYNVYTILVIVKCCWTVLTHLGKITEP